MGSLTREFGLCIVVVSLLLLTGKSWSQVVSQVPCFFIFGDSLVDNGNNNGLITLARANYRPYGIDFPQGTSGRFTNGRTFVDALAQLLGFRNNIPPYARTRGQAILGGVNFASGAAGIRDETGNNLMGRYFRGDSEAMGSYLGRCIIYSGMGSNDYLNNYFMRDFYNTGSRFTAQAYANALIQDYSKQLTALYNLGARKVIVTGVGQVGCIPYELARYNGTTNRCNENINSAISLFNSGVRKLVERFNKGELQGAKFVYFDSFKATNDLIANAQSYGFEEINKGCCGVGKNNGQVTCLPLQQACQDRSKYIFWDAFHPTEAANIVTAKVTFSSKLYTYPMTIQQLAAL